jgi:hypothetical protein
MILKFRHKVLSYALALARPAAVHRQCLNLEFAAQWREPDLAILLPPRCNGGFDRHVLDSLKQKI